MHRGECWPRECSVRLQDYLRGFRRVLSTRQRHDLDGETRPCPGPPARTGTPFIRLFAFYRAYIGSVAPILRCPLIVPVTAYPYAYAYSF